MPPELADEQIVKEALLDQERFALLIERYEAKLLRYLERLGIAAREDREDVLQNSFIKAYRNLNSFDLSLSFSSWMYRITHNEAMSFFRAKRARPKVALEGESVSEERVFGVHGQGEFVGKAPFVGSGSVLFFEPGNLV